MLAKNLYLHLLFNTMKQRANYIFYIIYGLLFFVTCNNAFFWDTIQLGSEHATFLYNTNFTSIILPPEMDSGHPPFLGLVLAISWKIFGRSLFVSHAVLLLFVFIIIYQTIALTKKLFPDNFLWLANAVILCEATLMTQCTLVSPDVILMAFLLLALNAILAKKQWLLMIAILFLCLVGMRGMMCSFILFCFHLYHQYSNKKDSIKSLKCFTITYWVYIPGVLLALSFLLFHYAKTGWIGYHAGSPWAYEFGKAPPKAVAFNFLLLCWRMVDFGKLFTYLVLGTCIIQMIKHKEKVPQQTWLLVGISVLFFLILALPLIRYNNLLCHRYFLPLYISVNILTIHLVVTGFKTKYAKLLLVCMIVSELTGNLWMYPKKYAMGWDATLAHLPYYCLRTQALKYLADNKIPLNTVGTGFPANICSNYIDLKSDSVCITSVDLNTNKYILYSNIFNQFGSQEFDIVFKNWKVIKSSFKKGSIEMIIFKKP